MTGNSTFVLRALVLVVDNDLSPTHQTLPSASEVTTIWRYTNVYIIIIITHMICTQHSFSLPTNRGPRERLG